MYVNTQQRWNFLKVPPGGCERGRWRGEKIKRKLSEVNIRVVSRGQNELIGKLIMAADDVISIGGRLWSSCTFQHSCIPASINQLA